MVLAIFSHIISTYPDEHGRILELLLLLRSVPRRLDESVDQKWILGESRRDEENALGDPLLLQQRVIGTRAHKMREATVALHEVLVQRQRFIVLAA